MSMIIKQVKIYLDLNPTTQQESRVYRLKH